MKAFKVWAERVFWLLYAVMFLADPVKDILRSADPLRAAIAYLIPLLVILAIWVALIFSFGFLKSRMSAPAFGTLSYTLAAVVLFIALVIWRATERYGGRGALFDDSWKALVTIAGMDSPALVVAGLAAPVVGLYGVAAALYGAAYLAQTRLAGDARLAAYLGLAALVAFGVLVGMPALAEYTDGREINGLNLATGLLLWLGMVVPAIGVLIAYGKIGDGRS